MDWWQAVGASVLPTPFSLLPLTPPASCAFSGWVVSTFWPLLQTCPDLYTLWFVTLLLYKVLALKTPPMAGSDGTGGKGISTSWGWNPPTLSCPRNENVGSPCTGSICPPWPLSLLSSTIKVALALLWAVRWRLNHFTLNGKSSQALRSLFHHLLLSLLFFILNSYRYF